MLVQSMDKCKELVKIRVLHTSTEQKSARSSQMNTALCGLVLIDGFSLSPLLSGHLIPQNYQKLNTCESSAYLSSA